jgi:hypothetical protein
MVWGTGAARRHARTPDPDLGVAPPATAICSRCETTVVLVGKALPRDWHIVDGEAVCGDCVPDDRRMCRPRARPHANERRIGPAEPSRHRGCRIRHEVAFGMAAIEIRAGTAPPLGRDEPVQFLMAPDGIDNLIIELDAIRAELKARGRADG